ncbi:MAG TPA: ABC transporter permease [Kiloniellales bacterium]|nr:ABC transporter permease [Kiloniellales bacterium]
MSTLALPAVASPTPADLARAERHDRWRRLALVAPALVLIGVLLVGPFAWLATLSFLDAQGSLTLGNYEMIFEQTSTLKILWTTFRVSLLVTFFCAILGYPVAYLLGLLPRRAAAFCLLAVLLPFWTSILVRTYAWMVLLARKGLVNTGLKDIGLIDEPLRLMHNESGTVIGMTHIMLPFLILPLYATIRSIDRSYLRAGASLGARPTTVFWRVFFPLSLPGFLGGLCFVFVLCLGFFVTPALLGGGKVQMIAMIIERNIVMHASWGAASSIGVVLLVTTVAVLWLGWFLRRGRRKDA